MGFNESTQSSAAQPPLTPGSRRRGIWTGLLTSVLAGGLIVPAAAQNIIIHEINRNTSNLTANGNEWVEVVLVEPLTAAQLNEYIVGDSQGSRTSKLGGYQFTAMETVASDFPAGTIIVIAAGNAGLAEDLDYNPGGGDWNLTLVLGQEGSNALLSNVGSGTFDFAGNDVAYVDTTPTGPISGEGFGVAWAAGTGALAQSATVVVGFSPADGPATTLSTFGDDYTATLDFSWLPDSAPTPGMPNGNDDWINGLRAGVPFSDPLIRTNARTLDFGIVEDDVFPLPTLEFEIRNSALASNTLVVSSLTVLPNDNNFRVVPPTPGQPINIAPGTAATVTVEYDPLGVPGSSFATLMIAHNDSNGDKGDLEVALQGSALSSIPPAAFTGTLPSVYEENFDVLPNLEQFETQEAGDFALPYEWIDNSTLPSWYASRTSNAPVTGIIASTGTDTNPFGAMSSSIYSFGDDGVAERALGSTAGGGTGTIVYGVRLRNETGEEITALQIEYTGEQWRKSSVPVPHTLQFSYSISSDPFLAAPLSDDGFVAVPTLDFVTPQFDGTTSPLDGNDPANRTELDVTLTGLSIPAGDEIFLRWKDIDDPSVDHPLAIDDVRITALPPTVPAIFFEATLAPFVSEVNVASAAQSYSVSAQNLSESLFITPPTGFEVSLSGAGPWTAAPGSLSIPQVDGSIAPTDVFVRALSASGGAISGTITHTSAGAGEQLVSVSAVIQSAPLALAELDVAVGEDFDSFGSAAQAPLPGGFALVGGSLNPADYTFTTGNAAGTSGTGTLTGTSSGNYYNLAPGVSAEATDRAMGFLTTNGFPSPRNLILTMVNQTGAQLTDLEVEFDIEKYRSGNRAFNFNLHYSTNGSDWTQVPEGSVNFPSDGANNIIYASPLVFPQDVTISGLSVGPGQRVYLRWEHAGVGGSTNGQALAVDNLVIVPRGTPVEPGQLGDINDDGVINVADVTLLAALVESGNAPSLAVGDINDDGFVDEADVAALAELIVND